MKRIKHFLFLVTTAVFVFSAATVSAAGSQTPLFENEAEYLKYFVGLDEGTDFNSAEADQTIWQKYLNAQFRGVYAGNNQRLSTIEDHLIDLWGYPIDTVALKEISGGTVTSSISSKYGGWTASGNELISFYVVKAGNHFALYELLQPASAFSWNTYDVWAARGTGEGIDLSHVTVYQNTFAPSGAPTPVPVPGSLPLLGVGLIAVFGSLRKFLS